MGIKKKINKLTTAEMEIAVAKYFGTRRHIIIPNLSYGLTGLRHECDIFVITKSGLGKEIEIKISKSDFLADFKKKHNHVDPEHRISEFYYAIPAYLYEECKDLIPEHAGILSCWKTNTGKLDAWLKKPAKKIKGYRKLTLDEQLKIATLGTMRIWNLKQKLLKFK